MVMTLLYKADGRDQDGMQAKKMTGNNAPVFITDRGKSARMLLSPDGYRKLHSPASQYFRHTRNAKHRKRCVQSIVHRYSNSND